MRGLRVAEVSGCKVVDFVGASGFCRLEGC